MSRPHVRCILTLLLLLPVASREAGAQRLSALAIGARAPVTLAAMPAAPPPAPKSPSTLKLAAITLAGSLGLAYGGGMVGLAVDERACERRHRGEEYFLIGPCFLPAGTGTAMGWSAGAVVGATVGATALAQRRGCPARKAAWRALGGALLGATPGVVAALGAKADRFPPSRSAVILTGPLLTGAGATLAVVGCRG